MKDKHTVTIIGGGLAGCEAAWQIAERGCKVHLIDMKPQRFSPAHHSEKLGNWSAPIHSDQMIRLRPSGC